MREDEHNRKTGIRQQRIRLVGVNPRRSLHNQLGYNVRGNSIWAVSSFPAYFCVARICVGLADRSMFGYRTHESHLRCAVQAVNALCRSGSAVRTAVR